MQQIAQVVIDTRVRRRECAGALACRPAAGMNAAGEPMRADSMVEVSEGEDVGMPFP